MALSCAIPSVTGDAGQIGRQGISNHRRIAGGKLCAVVNQFGLICDWDCATANVQGQTFHPLFSPPGSAGRCARRQHVQGQTFHPLFSHYDG